LNRELPGGSGCGREATERLISCQARLGQDVPGAFAHHPCDRESTWRGPMPFFPALAQLGLSRSTRALQASCPNGHHPPDRHPQRFRSRQAQRPRPGHEPGTAGSTNPCDRVPPRRELRRHDLPTSSLGSSLTCPPHRSPRWRSAHNKRSNPWLNLHTNDLVAEFFTLNRASLHTGYVSTW